MYNRITGPSFSIVPIVAPPHSWTCWRTFWSLRWKTWNHESSSNRMTSLDVSRIVRLVVTARHDGHHSRPISDPQTSLCGSVKHEVSSVCDRDKINGVTVSVTLHMLKRNWQERKHRLDALRVTYAVHIDMCISRQKVSSCSRYIWWKKKVL
jgi:hypothetical protein